jgi:hypothetical protein
MSLNLFSVGVALAIVFLITFILDKIDTQIRKTVILETILALLLFCISITLDNWTFSVVFGVITLRFWVILIEEINKYT